MHTTRRLIAIMGIFSLLFSGCSEKPAGTFAIGEKELLVRGWSDAELGRIIGDFRHKYRDRPAQDFSTEVHAGDGGVFRVTFLADIEPRLFCWLINYVQYPENFDLQSRRILVAGRATISSDFLPSDQSLIGKRITLYIPTADKEFDVVFGRVDGQSYEYPFASERWRRASAPRLPDGVRDLK